MRFTSWLETLKRGLRLAHRRRPRSLARSIDRLEDRTLLSVSTLFVNGELRVIADSDEAVAIGTDSLGNVQVTVNGTVDTTTAPVASSAVESLVVTGGDLDNVLDLSGVQAADYSYQDIDGNPVTVQVDAGHGDDTITGPLDLAATILAGDGDDSVQLLDADNQVDGGDGNDTLLGGLGADTLAGGDGNDTIDGWSGDDSLSGGDGNDVILGGDDNDAINGGDGEDWLEGLDGNDEINGESGEDTIIGGLGDDTLLGGGGRDELYGDLNDPSILSDGSDLVQGQGENDTIVGGGGADVLQGGPGDDFLRSTFEVEIQQVPTAPIPPPPPPTAAGFPDAVDSGGGTDSGTSHDMTNGPGDASLAISVDGTGTFGTASFIGGTDDGAVYDPIGATPPAATTTFESSIFFRNNTADPGGVRPVLSAAASNLSTIRGLPTEANSTFDIGTLSFAMTQTVTPMLDAFNVQTGTLLTQTLRFTNTGTASQDFEFVRYIDGDLDFDGTLIDGGGRFVTAANDEVLFETDQGGSGATDTTFLGITGKHGTVPTSNRFEIDHYPSLLGEIGAGTALDGLISGDGDGDQFVDSGQEYDITLALRNTYSLGGGASDIYTTHTIFGSGAPNAVGASQSPVASDDVGITRANNSTMVDVVSNDVDPDGELDYATVTVVNQPANGVAIAMGDGRISYSPANDFDGVDSFTYTVNDFDGSTSNEATVTMTVLPADLGDTLNGGGGSDTVVASDGNDRLFGGGGDDSLDGSFGNDSINGQGGNDTLLAGTGGDWLNGGGGNDFLDSRAINNVFISVDNLQIDPEGDSGLTPAIFTLSLSSPADSVVTVQYATSSDGSAAGGTAIADIDYETTTGMATFAIGELSTTVTVNVIGDTFDEVDEETFFLNLFNPVNATIFDGSGEGRIYDDDENPNTGPVVVTSTLNVNSLVGSLIGGGGAGLLVTGSNLSGHQLSGGEMSAGTYTVGTQATYGLTNDGVVISNGDAADYSAGADLSTSTTTGYGVAATAAQEALLDPITGGFFDHNDVTQLDINFDMLPGYDTLYFEVVFGSEEWPTFVGTFIDGFGLYVNGTNVALVNGLPINIDHPDMAVVAGTELNAVLAPGGDPRLLFTVPVGDGSTGNTVTFIVADLIDTAYDTTVFISSLGGSLPLATPLSPPPPNDPTGVNVDDTLIGQGGHDTLLAGEGFDRLNGGSGNDYADGGGGADDFNGGSGNDTLLGGTNDDTLDGQGGADLVHGGTGDDTLVWWHGGGSDNLHGDEGSDIVVARGDAGNQSFTVTENVNDLVLQTTARLQLSDGTHATNVGFSVQEVEFQPGDGDDVITVTDLPDVPSLLVRVNGQGGDDVLTAAGADPGVVRLNFDGGEGSDTVTGSLVRDTIRGGDGDDHLFGDGGNDSMRGGDGDDVLDGQDGNDLLLGEIGFDTLDGNSGDDQLFGGDDRDFLVGGVGNDTLSGDLGRDTLNGKSGDDSLLGGEGVDRLYGGNGDDTLDGGRDNDSLYGNNGDDRLLGDHGADSIKGGNGNDTLVGGDGDDKLLGERGDDQIGGGDGSDTLNGSRGDDILVGGDGDDTLLAGSGADVVLGNLGDDYVDGQGGTRDTISGGEGQDLFFDDLPSEINELFSLPNQLLSELDAV